MLKDMHNVLTVFCFICKEQKRTNNQCLAPHGPLSGMHIFELFSGEKDLKERVFISVFQAALQIYMNYYMFLGFI